MSAGSVLFIGNSYTSRNDLPRLVRALSRADLDRDLTVNSVCEGGFTLDRHAREGDALTCIGALPRSNAFVVLQEQSQMPLVDPSGMIEATRVLGRAIEDAGALPVMYMTWARAGAPRAQQELIATSYLSAATAIDARVAPVGIAWSEFAERGPHVALHDVDASHPSRAGSYLAALVLYATIMERRVSGLPALAGVDASVANAMQTIVDRLVPIRTG